MNTYSLKTYIEPFQFVHTRSLLLDTLVATTVRSGVLFHANGKTSSAPISGSLFVLCLPTGTTFQLGTHLIPSRIATTSLTLEIDYRQEVRNICSMVILVSLRIFLIQTHVIQIRLSICKCSECENVRNI